MLQTVHFRDLGFMEYAQAWALQESLLQKNLQAKMQAGALVNEVKETDSEAETGHHLLFVEHPPVYTLGKSGKAANVLISEADMEKRGIRFFHTNRGGDITYHGPGQLVGYPILDLEKFYTDIGKYLRALEEVIIKTLLDYGIRAERSPGETGVWLDASKKGMERKICAMGVRCSRWITMHGFALNANTDLTYFDHIIPCGIPHKKVTSIAAELGEAADMGDLKQRLLFRFEEVFNVRLAMD